VCVCVCVCVCLCGCSGFKITSYIWFVKIQIIKLLFIRIFYLNKHVYMSHNLYNALSKYDRKVISYKCTSIDNTLSEQLLMILQYSRHDIAAQLFTWVRVLRVSILHLYTHFLLDFWNGSDSVVFCLFFNLLATSNHSHSHTWFEFDL
jgi:hypothetical protein